MRVRQKFYNILMIVAPGVFAAIIKILNHAGL